MIRRWNENDIDNGIVVWVSVYGILIHAWNVDFFASLENSMGVFICVDESTAKNLASTRID